MVKYNDKPTRVEESYTTKNVRDKEKLLFSSKEYIIGLTTRCKQANN